MYKMIGLDVDGTLLNDDKIISAATKDELTRLARLHDVKLIVASSRMPESINLVAAQLGTNDPVVAYNGALVLDSKTGVKEREILFSAVISADVAADVVSFSLRHDVHIGLFNNNEWFVNDGGYWTQRETRNTSMTPIIYDLNNKIKEWESKGLGAHKIMLRGTERELDTIAAHLKEDFQLQVISHRIKDTILEITPVGISKASAVAFLCRRLHINQNEVIAFGDSQNDMDLLKWSGLGVAMGNATDEVKQSAKEVTASNNEDGIAVTLKKYFGS